MESQPDEKARQLVRQRGLDVARREAAETMGRYEPASPNWSYWSRVRAHIERLAADMGFARKSAP